VTTRAMLMWPRSLSRPLRSGQAPGRISAPGMMNGAVPWRCAVPAEAAPLVVGIFNWELGVRRVTDPSGAIFTISKEEEAPKALSDKIVTVWGLEDQKTAACGMVVSRVRQTQRLSDSEPGTFVIIVPRRAVPDIMGANDARIWAMALTSGAEFSIGYDAIPGMADVAIRISGTLLEVVSAVSQVNGVLQDLVERGRLSEGDFSWRPLGSKDEPPPPLQPAAPPAHRPPPLAASVGADSLEVSPFKCAPPAGRPPTAPTHPVLLAATARKVPVPPKLPPRELIAAMQARTAVPVTAGAGGSSELEGAVGLSGSPPTRAPLELPPVVIGGQAEEQQDGSVLFPAAPMNAPWVVGGDLVILERAMKVLGELTTSTDLQPSKGRNKIPHRDSTVTGRRQTANPKAN